MNLLWTPPALRWKPFSRAAGVVALYFLVGISATSGKPSAASIIALLVGFFVPFPMHVFARFAPLGRGDQTEWLMGMGLTRKSLGFRYAVDLVWWSLVHAVGGSWMVSRMHHHEFFDRLWGDSEKNVRFVVGLFLIQLTFRAGIGLLAHLDRSTLVPARMKDAFNSSFTSRWAGAGWFTLAAILLLTVLAAPCLLVALTESFYWLAIPAALYLRLAHAMASTSEFVRKTTPPTDEWGLPVVTASPPPPRQFFEEMVTDRTAPGALRGLCWNGLSRGVKVASLILLLPMTGAWIMWVLAPFDREATGILLLVTVSLPLVFLLLGAHKLFSWTASDDAIEYLFVRGVTLRTMSRVRMTVAILVAAGILSFLGAITPMMHELLWPPLWAAVLYFCSIVLLECNPDPRISNLAKLMRGLSIFVLIFGNLVVGKWLSLRGTPWLFLGLAVCVPALASWARAYIPLMLRR